MNSPLMTASQKINFPKSPKIKNYRNSLLVTRLNYLATLDPPPISRIYQSPKKGFICYINYGYNIFKILASNITFEKRFCKFNTLSCNRVYTERELDLGPMCADLYYF